MKCVGCVNHPLCSSCVFLAWKFIFAAIFAVVICILQKPFVGNRRNESESHNRKPYPWPHIKIHGSNSFLVNCVLFATNSVKRHRTPYVKQTQSHLVVKPVEEVGSKVADHNCGASSEDTLS